MLDLRQLRSLLILQKTGTLTGVAYELGYTQPAVSQQIRNLERAVGVPLVMRTGNTVQLTEAGVALARHAGTILNGVAAAEEELAALAGLRTGRVRLNAFPSGSAALVPAAIAEVTAAHPGLEVSLVESEPPESIAGLRDGECDIALAFSYTEDNGDRLSDLHVVHLLDDPLRAVLPRDHPLANRVDIRVEQLAADRWIAGCPRCRANLVDVCRRAGFEPEIAFATDDNAAAQSLVAHGLGVALMPSLVLSAVRHPDIAEVPVRPAIHRRVVALAWPDARSVPAVAAMLKALQSAVPARGRSAVARPAKAK